jgi:peptidoglycan/LPS O-acetylase OafA/YrhL
MNHRSETVHQTRHFASLDGLRGFAAVSVLIFHLGQILHQGTLAANAGLAVDLFFCLSGYVLCAAYQKRSDSLSILQFMRIRLVRLMPLIVLAIVISAPYIILRDSVENTEIPYFALGKSILLGLFNLPDFSAPPDIGGPQLFPLNFPQYTLFLELAVNAFWWLTRRANPIRLSIVIMAICLPLLFVTGLAGATQDTFWCGIPRVGASFFAGVLTYQLQGNLPQWRHWSWVFWGIFAIMAVLFYLPVTAPFLVQILWVAVLSPVLIVAGTRTRLPGPVNRLCMFGGAISYPLYALHYPIFCWVNGLYRAHYGPHNLPIEVPLVVAAALVGSFAFLKLYDEPVRALLSAAPGLDKRRVTAT